jgi:hypothetical protein
MKHIKKLTVHPELGNDMRRAVIDWCIKQWGDYYDTEAEHVWWITSNYDRSLNGTFDIVFNDVKAAEFFILRWGGNVFDVEYEEYYVPDPEVLDRLFEV